jgi:hypothetical protein
MPTMWFAKDGRRPHTQSGPGTSITHNEVSVLFSEHEIKYVGRDAPNINPEAPSAWPVNVVLELESSESPSALLPALAFI